MTTAPPAPKPWPDDAVMVVAPDRTHAAPEGAVDCYCRDCAAPLHCGPATVRAAMAKADREGTRVRFFCRTCSRTYDPRTP